MLPDRLVTMANQIGKFFASQPGDEDRAVADIIDHVRKFWDPRMREAILTLPPDAAATLDPLPRRAIESLAVERMARDREATDLAAR
jgi:formate dehydrogenase subunit delta